MSGPNLSREAMRLYMRDYRRGIRRRPIPVMIDPPSKSEVAAIKESLKSAERLRAIGVGK